MEQKGVIAIEGKGKERNIELNKMKTFDDMLVQQLQDEEFKKEYEAIQPEMDEIRARVMLELHKNNKYGSWSILG